MFDNLFLERVLEFGPKGQKFDDFYKNQIVILGISGGRDSVVLLHFLHHLKTIGKIKDLRLLHVNYGLRGEESDGDAQLVSDLSKQNQVPLQLHVVEAEQRAARRGKGIQEWARDLRRAYFAEEIAQGHLVALGHHQDDLLETMVFRAVRGSSPLRLGGMQPFEHGIWRPFLGLWREEIERIQTGNKLPYREDSSNAKISYDRNYVRHQILQPLSHRFPGAKEKLLHLAQDLGELSVWALDSIAEDLDDALQIANLTPSRLIGLPTVLQRLLVAEFLQHSLEKLGEVDLLINREIVTQVLRASHSENAYDRAKFVHLGRQYSVQINKEGIRLAATDPRKQERLWQWARARLPLDLRVLLGPGFKQDWQVQALEGLGQGTGWIHMENLSDVAIQVRLHQPYTEADQKIRKRVKTTMQKHRANSELRARWMVLTLDGQRELICDGNDIYQVDSGVLIPRDQLGLRIKY